MAIIKGPTQQVRVTLPSKQQGQTGYTGSQGPIGYTGSAGVGGGGGGYTGSQGYTGSLGYTGSQGYTGSAGAGYTGSQGTTGFTGSQGSLGYTGSAGVGYTGSAGTSGTTGFTGSQGDIGYTGSAGTGYTGSQGTTGYTGSAGAANTGNITFSGNTISTTSGNIELDPAGAGVIDVKSNRITNVTDPSSDQDAATKAYVDSQLSSINPGDGYTGSQGYTGSAGEIGYTGSLGYTGSAGTPGITGYTGSSGTLGYTGSAGTGYTGSAGYTGSGGELNITTSATAPVSPNLGDIWIDETTGIQYFWVSDGDSYQWVEYGNVGIIGYTGSRGYTGSSGLGNNKKFSWSAPADGTPVTAGTVLGTIAGSTGIFSNTTSGVRLTNNSTSQDGRVVWNLTNIDFTKDLVMYISFYQEGADGISFGIGGTNNFANSQPYTVVNNSLSFWYKTNTNKTQFYLNGSAVGSETDYLTGTTYEGSWLSAKLVLQTIGSTRYAFLYHGHGGHLQNSLDITSWAPNGSYIFVGAWTGGVAGTHFVNAVSIDYI